MSYSESCKLPAADGVTLAMIKHSQNAVLASRNQALGAGGRPNLSTSVRNLPLTEAKQR